MAGLATTAADKPGVGETPDALTFDLDRSYYRFYTFLYALFLFLAILLMTIMPLSEYHLTGSVFCIVVSAVAMAWSAKPLRLSEPVVRIDSDGIHDRRVMREAVPWSKIKRVYVREVADESRVGQTTFAVVIDVGHPRVADMIMVRGLAMEPPHDDAALAQQIADYANKMRVRHARASAPQASRPGLSGPSTPL